MLVSVNLDGQLRRVRVTLGDRPLGCLCGTGTVGRQALNVDSAIPWRGMGYSGVQKEGK